MVTDISYESEANINDVNIMRGNIENIYIKKVDKRYSIFSE